MPGILDEVRQIVDRAEHAANKGVEMVEEPWVISERVLKTAAHALNPVADAEELAQTLQAAEGLRFMTMFSHAFGVFNALMLVWQIKEWLLKVTGRIPMMGRPIRALIDIMVLPITHQLDQVGDMITGTGTQHLRNHIQATGWALNYMPDWEKVKHTSNIKTPATQKPSHLTPTDADIVNLSRQIATVNARLDRLEQALGTVQQAAHVPPQVWQDIHALDAVQVKQARAIHWLADRVNAQAGALAAVDADLHRITGELGNLRTVSAGWSDVREQLDNTIRSVEHLRTSTSVELHRQNRELTGLAPLGLLLSAGPAGLRTLRQLEDTPCMCPKFQGIPNELGTALALMEFVENG